MGFSTREAEFSFFAFSLGRNADDVMGGCTTVVVVGGCEVVVATGGWGALTGSNVLITGSSGFNKFTAGFIGRDEVTGVWGWDAVVEGWTLEVKDRGSRRVGEETGGAQGGSGAGILVERLRPFSFFTPSNASLRATLVGAPGYSLPMRDESDQIILEPDIGNTPAPTRHCKNGSVDAVTSRKLDILERCGGFP